MKRTVLGVALLAASSLSYASSMSCSTKDGYQHQIIMDSNSSITIHKEEFSFMQVNNLKGGQQMLVFKSPTTHRLAGIAKTSNNEVVYQVRDNQNQLLDSGICR